MRLRLLGCQLTLAYISEIALNAAFAKAVSDLLYRKTIPTPQNKILEESLLNLRATAHVFPNLI